jgi:hypothetical protein
VPADPKARPARFPFGGSSTACRCADRVTPSCAPSREGSVLLGVLLSARITGLLGSPSSAATSTFRPGPAVSPRTPSTARFRVRLHPPASFPPSPECYGLQTASRARRNLATSPRPKSASLGVLSLIATSTSGVHHSPGNPYPRVKFRPRRFSRPRRFAPPPASAGLFHPAATSRVCPAGVCPSPRSRTGFPRPNHALLPLNGAACGLTRASSPALGFRALLPALSAVPTEVV